MITKSEALRLGMPIGDPFGGPAYGELNMPFAIGPSVAAAAASIGTAATLGTAASIGTAALATASAIGTIAAVAGTVMSVVGLVTGDNDLIKLGGIIGIAGGVTSLASGALAGATGLAATTAAQTATQTAAQATQAPAQTGAQAMQAATKAITPQGLVNLPQNIVNPPSVSGGLLANAEQAITPTMTTPIAPTTTAVNSAASAALDNAAIGNAAFNNPTTLGKDVLDTTKVPKQTKSFFDKMVSFADKHPYITLGIAQTVAGGISGMVQAASDQEKLDYQRGVDDWKYTNVNTPGRSRATVNVPANTRTTPTSFTKKGTLT